MLLSHRWRQMAAVELPFSLLPLVSKSHPFASGRPLCTLASLWSPFAEPTPFVALNEF